MFQEQLNKAVDQLSKLNEINSSDLKLLIERYPFCQSAHVLYTKKLHEEKSSLFEKELQKTASLVYDRKVLFQLIEKMPLQAGVNAGYEQEEELSPIVNSAIEEQTEQSKEPLLHVDLPEVNVNEAISDPQVLIHEELTDEILEDMIREQEVIEEEEKLVSPDDPLLSNTIESESEKIIIQENETREEEEISSVNYTIEELKVSDVEIKEEPEPEKQKLTEPLTEDPVVKAPKSDEPIFEMPGYIIERELGTLDEEDEIRINIKPPVETEETQLKIEEPVNFDAGTSSFTGWLKKVAGESKARIVGLKEEHKPIRLYQNQETQSMAQRESTVSSVNEEVEITEDFAGKLAQKSIEPDERLVTETYARILFMQGKYAKAIEVYEALSLKKPSKSDYFAALIEQIKKRK